MNNPFTDKYFSKSRRVAEKAGLNPTVKYRVFGRFKGIAALEPAKCLIEALAPSAKVEILPTGTPFQPKDTIMIIEDKFQNIVELETMYLWWSALPCYCAQQAKDIVKAAQGRTVLDFAARHMYDAASVALASYGAKVGGITQHSTDVGANAFTALMNLINSYKAELAVYSPETAGKFGYIEQGVGTTPHALLAIFGGDYTAMANAYLDAFPEDKFVALIDYNNKEIDDSLTLLRTFGDKLWGVRIDTCGVNHAQKIPSSEGSMEYVKEKGVSLDAVAFLRAALDLNGGKKVKIVVSSGFNALKTAEFASEVPNSFDAIGTGSFIPPNPTCTADIFEVDGKRESKKGREWGYIANKKFYSLIPASSDSGILKKTSQK